MNALDQNVLRKYFRTRIKDLLGEDPGDFVFEYPPRIELGDLAMPFCFSLAKTLRKAPRQIAQEVVEGLQPPPGIAKLEVAGAGYINIFFDRESAVKALYTTRHRQAEPDEATPNVTVEHTSVNPNKAAHIGHIRNSCLGDTMVRLLRYLGRPVRVQNYIDDTGVQVADVSVGFRHILGKGPQEVRGIPEPFDHFCWDLYARVGKFYAEDESRLELRRDAMHAMESGEGVYAEIGAIVADRVVRCHLKTTERLGILYELLVWEGDILRNKFWERAFELLKKSKSMYLAEEGRNAGCWVMDLSASEEFADMDDPDKIIVRSDGTVTYVGKDIAYHLWKFGKLGLDFPYKPFHLYENGEIVWTTASEEQDSDEKYDSPPADIIYNVIDVGQEYTQNVVAESMRAVAGEKTAQGYHHFAYEKVALTPAACRDLGVELEPGEENKPFVAMSGRRGLGIKADDLIDAIIEKARSEVASRNPGFSEEEIAGAARSIAVGALRYFMIKYGRNRVLAFDFNEALAFEGESGPYISYAMVRANNIFGKLSEVDGLREEEVDEVISQIDWSAIYETGAGDDTWELVSMINRLPAVAADAVEGMELSVFAKFVYNLAQKFNAWYHKYPILHEKVANLKKLRIVVLQVFRYHFHKALECIGIEAPSRM